MSERDVSSIRVGNHRVSVIGMKEAIAGFADEFSGRADEEVGEVMLHELEKKNYIPASARDQYRKTFAREFRKALGQPYSEPASEGLDIKIFGAGCDQCNRLEQLVMEILVELNFPATVEHVTDAREFPRHGVLAVPALHIAGRQAWVGSVPPKDKLISLIRAALPEAGKE
ncbi:MAG: thioredoxin family protein [Syntrophobacteraceae bacterium]